MSDGDIVLWCSADTWPTTWSPDASHGQVYSLRHVIKARLGFKRVKHCSCEITFLPLKSVVQWLAVQVQIEQPAAGRDSSKNKQANEWSRHFHVLRAALCSARAACLCYRSGLYVSIIVGKILNPRDAFKLGRREYFFVWLVASLLLFTQNDVFLAIW